MADSQVPWGVEGLGDSQRARLEDETELVLVATENRVIPPDPQAPGLSRRTQHSSKNSRDGEPHIGHGLRGARALIPARAARNGAQPG